MADMSLGTIGGLTGIQSMQDIVDKDQYSNDKFDDIANLGGKSLSTVAGFIPGAQPFLMATRGIGELANTVGKIDANNYDPSKHTSDLDKIGNFVQGAGNIASSFVNPMGAASSLSKGAKTAMNVGKIAGLGATAVNAGRDIANSQGGTYDPTNLLNLGMGVANSGFFGGNTNTSGNFTNTKGAVDYTPTMDTPLYAAMGGAVNAPNMMKYAQGGMTPATQINVERGELLVDKGGKILTEYRGGGMVPHPEDGSMDDRGTVPAQEGQFVITKRLAPNYKSAMTNNDKLYADAMRNNIAFDKQRKEAKQQSQQAMAEQTMMAKFGGMVGQYGYGGGVKMYAAGGPPGPLEPSENTGYVYNFGEEDPSAATNMYDFDASTPFSAMNLGMYSTQPSRYYSGSNPNIYPSPNAYGNPAAAPVYNAGNVTGYTPTNFRMPSVGAPNKNAFITSQVYGTNPNTSYGPWNAQNAPTSPIVPAAPAQDLQDSQGPYGKRSYYDLSGTPDTSSALPTNNTYTLTAGTDANGTPTPSWFNRNKEDLKTAGGKALMYGPGIYNMARSFGKPFQMNAADYQLKDTMNPYEEEYRPDYRTYNAAMYAMRKAPGSGSLAGITIYLMQGKRILLMKSIELIKLT
jgi:hypothetical protein